VAIIRDLWITTTFITSHENLDFSGRPMLVILSIEMGEYGEKSIIKRGKNTSCNTKGNPHRSPGELYHNVAHAFTYVGRTLRPAVYVLQ
jgi:hypothetical protein